MPVPSFFTRYKVSHLFHFTDEANIPLIIAHGGLLSLKRLVEAGITPPRPGGNQWSHDADRYKGVDRFVHLGFVRDHPMKWVAEHKESRIGPVRVLSVRASVLELPGVMYTADVANKSGVPIISPEEADQQLDAEALYTYIDWKVPENRARRDQAARYEVLVPDIIPLDYIEGLG